MRIPGMGGTVVPYAYQTDWSRVAKLIVHQSLQTQPGERVLLLADPTYFPDLTEQVRIELARAGAHELPFIMPYSPGLEAARRRLRVREDPTRRSQEDELLESVFGLADIFIWLPRSWSHNFGQTEHILRRWQGRALHFHWVAQPVHSVAFRKLSEQYERALFIDYSALNARQEELASALRGATVEVRSEHGTELTLSVAPDAHVDISNGDASRAYVETHAQPGSARDRERELPCGLIRTTDLTAANGTLVFPDATFGDRRVGRLTAEIEAGQMTRLSSEHQSAWVNARYALETGDRDRVGELLIGCNPELRPDPEVDLVPYWGSGAGIVRVTIGDNVESGGSFKSSFYLGHFLTDATVTVNGRTIVERGELL